MLAITEVRERVRSREHRRKLASMVRGRIAEIGGPIHARVRAITY